MVQINGTTGPDDFLNGAGSDAFVGLAGNDTLHMNFGFGQDLFYGGTFGGPDGTDMLQLDTSLFFLAYAIDTFIDYAPLPDFDLRREFVLTDGTKASILNHWYTGWQQFRASDTATLAMLFSGGAAGSTVNGTAAAEFLAGADNSQTMNGGAGNDVIFANGGSDKLYGGDGFDYLSAGREDGANDTFDGGAGNDIVSYSGAGAVTIDLASGYAYGTGIGVDRLVSVEQAAGSQSNDVMIGTAGANTFWGLFGNDYVYARDGNDIAYGGAGIDVLLAEGGADSLFGEGEQDYLFGGAGSDTMYGGAGVDVLLGGDDGDVMFGGDAGDASADYFYGEGGNDTGYGADGNDIFILALGDDVAYGGMGQDYFYLGDGNDQAFGGAGVDVLLGEAGNDTLTGGSGVDYYFGGAGADVFAVTGEAGAAVIQDFDRAEGDRISLPGAQWGSSFAALLNNAADMGNYTILYAPDGTFNVWIIGQPPGQLQAGDFTFT